ncbi:MAG: hypothetical protein P4M12_12585 [Gammaproteobacteria bacterium]|nr:hypothetical protein [Gammaproteobacteria bacterium]
MMRFFKFVGEAIKKNKINTVSLQILIPNDENLRNIKQSFFFQKPVAQTPLKNNTPSNELPTKLTNK